MTFREFIAGMGIIPPNVIERDRWQRCATETHPRKRNARIWLDEDGRVGFARNFETFGEEQKAERWEEGGSANERTQEQRSIDNAALSKKIAARAAEEAAGTARARKAYDSAQPLMSARHPYCERKRIEMLGCDGLKVDAKGGLLIPMFRGREMISVQRISADGEKRFATGAPTKGTVFWIARPRSTVTILAEGFCTAATCFEAVQTAGVMVCFSASNMVEVAKLLRWKGLVCVAGDNDYSTYAKIGRNPGLLAAAEAAQIIGTGYAVPDEAEGISDWNDVFVSRLETLEEAELGARFKSSPWKLRRAALAPIAASLMRACKKI